jgi:hypothetical protein
LLLVISSTIVLRSFVIRRRRIEQAIALGLYPGAHSHRRRRVGAKPKLYDVWVDECDSKDARDTWEDIMVRLPEIFSAKESYRMSFSLSQYSLCGVSDEKPSPVSQTSPRRPLTVQDSSPGSHGSPPEYHLLIRPPLKTPRGHSPV